MTTKHSRFSGSLKSKIPREAKKFAAKPPVTPKLKKEA